MPKGPSTDPKNKRLAMMVEDHPFDYKNFESIIPTGEYGGGTVIVWDERTYEPIEKIKGKKAQEKHLLDQLNAGSLKILLHGKKLKGEYALVKTNGMGENGWLLIKHKDIYAAASDITKKDKSVLSQKTVEQMEKSSDKVWKNGHEEKLVQVAKGKKGAEKTVSANFEKSDRPVELGGKMTSELKVLLKRGKKSRIPIGMKPMLATLVMSLSMILVGYTR